MNTDDQEKALFSIMKEKDVTRLAKFIDENPYYDFNKPIYHFGGTALHTACSEGNVMMVRMLMRVPGLDLNVRNFFGSTPLSDAEETSYATLDQGRKFFSEEVLAQKQEIVSLLTSDPRFRSEITKVINTKVGIAMKIVEGKPEIDHVFQEK